MSIIKGESSSEKPSTAAPIFHDSSRSRDRGYIHCMTPRMYSDVEM